MKKTITPALLLAVVWLVTVTVLFCLPGSALPSAGWMSTLQVDKWVHVGIFFLLLLLWHRALQPSGRQRRLLVLTFLGYGCLIELVQHYLIVNRSFDVFDLLADAVGIIAALAFLRYIKK